MFQCRLVAHQNKNDLFRNATAFLFWLNVIKGTPEDQTRLVKWVLLLTNACFQSSVQARILNLWVLIFGYTIYAHAPENWRWRDFCMKIKVQNQMSSKSLGPCSIMKTNQPPKWWIYPLIFLFNFSEKVILKALRF